MEWTRTLLPLHVASVSFQQSVVAKPVVMNLWYQYAYTVNGIRTHNYNNYMYT